MNESCIVRLEARRGHDSAERTDVSEWPLGVSDLTMYETSYLNPIMTWIIWLLYITKPQFASEVPNREVANHAL